MTISNDDVSDPASTMPGDSILGVPSGVAPDEAVRIAMRRDRLLAAADVLYARSEAGIGGLPLACRPAIRAARLIYAEIGAEIGRASCRERV